MENIKNYEDFVNEKIDLDKYKIKLKYYGINYYKFFLISILVPIIIVLRIFWKKLKKQKSPGELTHIIKRCYKSVKILNSLIHKNVLNIDKMEEKDIIILFNEIRKKYNKKYKNRDFDEDVKNILNNWNLDFKDGPNRLELLIKYYLDLSKKEETSNKYLDIDPYREDDWEDETIKEFIPVNIFNYNDSNKSISIINNLIVGKNIIFNELHKHDEEGEGFKKKIKVYRVNFVFGRSTKMIVIDNELKTYNVNTSLIVKILD